MSRRGPTLGCASHGDPDTSPPAPSPLDALARWVPRAPGASPRSWLLAGRGGRPSISRVYTQQIPALARSRWAPLRELASGFKAGTDYDIVHAGMTAQRRQARAAVRPVYDYSPSVADDVRGAVRAAFAGARTRLAEAPLAPVAEPRPAAAPRLRPAAEEPLEPQALEALRAEFQTRLFAQAEALGADDLQALRAMGFSPERRAATLALLERAYTQGEDARVPAGHAPGAAARGPQGLTLRNLRQHRSRLPALGAPACWTWPRRTRSWTLRLAARQPAAGGHGDAAPRRAAPGQAPGAPQPHHQPGGDGRAGGRPPPR